MCLHAVIGDIFGSAYQLLAEGDYVRKVRGNRFVWRWSRGSELLLDLSAAKFCSGIVKSVPKCFPHFHRVVDIVDEWKEFVAPSEVYLC
jgi:hypothetical protein